MTMLRQAYSRTQRSKGFRVKHALQICVLIAICIWLLYQVKHSHDKRKAFEESNSKILSEVVENQPELVRLGRKDLPYNEETGSVTGIHTQEEESEDTQDEEHDTHQEESMAEGQGAGNEEIDEDDQDRGDEEADQGEESTEEEVKDGHFKEKDGQENTEMLDNREHEGGSQEAREENYKRDDASSAVVHDTHVSDSDSHNGGAGNADEGQVVDKADDGSGANGSEHDEDSSATDASNDEVAENLKNRVAELENVTDQTNDGSRGDGDLNTGPSGGSIADTVAKGNETMLINDPSSNNTSVEVDNRDAEVEFSKPDVDSDSNSTAVNYGSRTEQQTNLTSSEESNTQMELRTNSAVDADDNSQPDDAVTSNLGESENIEADNVNVGEDAHISQNEEEQDGKSNSTAESESEEHSTAHENGEAAQGESDSSTHTVITEEERDARTYLSTLPVIQNEVKATDVEAAGIRKSLSKEL